MRGNYKSQQPLFNSKDKNILTIIACGFVISLFAIFVLNIQRNSAQKNLNDLKTEQNKISDQINRKQTVVNNSAIKKQEDSLSDKQKLNAKQYALQKNLPTSNENLFKIVLTYQNYNQYLARKEECAPYMTKDAIKKSNLFTSGKMGESGNFVDENQINVEFKKCQTYVGTVKNNKASVLIYASYETWITDNKHGLGRDVYEGTFDYTLGKYISLNRLNNLYSGRIDEEDN